jgi:hypothetical protein
MYFHRFWPKKFSSIYQVLFLIVSMLMLVAGRARVRIVGGSEPRAVKGDWNRIHPTHDDEAVMDGAPGPLR